MAPETARLAVEQGYTEVYLYAQGLKGWKKAGYPITSVEKIPNIPVDRLPAARLKVMLREDESLVILDIRDDNLYGKMKFDLPRVIHISSIDLLDRMESIPNDRRIVLSCHKGKLSPKIAPFLKGKGYDIAGILDGGINAWKDMGFSVK
jgi:rhodanese-related sulfurtransferase